MAVQQIHCYNIQLVYKEDHTQVQNHYNYQISFLLIQCIHLQVFRYWLFVLVEWGVATYKVPVRYLYATSYPEFPDIQSALTSK